MKQRSVDSFAPPTTTSSSISATPASSGSSNSSSSKKWARNLVIGNTNSNGNPKQTKLVRGFEPSAYSYESLSPATSVEEVDESIEETDTGTSYASTSNQLSDSSGNVFTDGLKLKYAEIVTTNSEYAKVLNRSVSALDGDTTDNGDNSSRKSSKNANTTQEIKTCYSSPTTPPNYADREQFIKESGILGTTDIMGSAISGLFRKQSKVIPMHQDPVDKGQVSALILYYISVTNSLVINYQ